MLPNCQTLRGDASVERLFGQLQPLVVPQLGQAWQEPARCIWMPHCMQMGASMSFTGVGDAVWDIRSLSLIHI